MVDAFEDDEIEQAAEKKVFLNIPYAREYEERLIALIAGLSLYGLVPTMGMVAGDNPNRLECILKAIGECKLSIHDLTWMELDAKEPRTPRFNMPFEFGLAVALAKVVGNSYVVLDTVPNRLDKALSDARGMDAQIFDGSPMGVFRALGNIFHREDFQPEPRHFLRLFTRLKTLAGRLHKGYGYKSLFEAKPFSGLRRSAARVANEIRAAVPPSGEAIAKRPRA